MTVSIHHRRSFLQLMAAAGIASPLAWSLGRRAVAAVPATRALFVYIPDGVIPEHWHPSRSGTDFTLPSMSEPLDPIRDDLVFLRGIDMYGGGPTHEGGVAKLLTGTADISLDVFLGQELGRDALEPSVQLGVASTFQGGQAISYVGPGQELKPDDNPINAFSRLFGSVSGQGTSDLERARQASVLDRSLDDLSRLREQLGVTERQKLDVHLDALRTAERKLDGATLACDEAAWDSRGFTVSEDDYYPKTYHRPELFDLMGELQMDLAVVALACGVTPVVTLTWSHQVSPTVIPGLGTRAHHDASHYGRDAQNAEGIADFVTNRRWYSEQLVYLIEALRAQPSPSGTLLDEMVIFVGTDINDGDLHDHTDMPFLLAGGASGQLQGGRALDYRGTNGGENESHARLLVSIAQMMGVEIDTFGFTGKGTGGLPGLLG